MNRKTEYREYPQGNREHKSTLFCKAFEEKKHLLELYNSVNDSNYQNPEDLEVNTLEDVVYISMFGGYELAEQIGFCEKCRDAYDKWRKRFERKEQT